ncbi:membrane protein [Allostreptomyces psammosilenae]|uniref:Membrane protein n=2 Tax=Allostreptomyces psammosilenae TaxID=1892865 RepID=A0A852ZPT7_9ACTN|nr:YihY/virulence factor BrkB family protein [Allostreptomyces psammosilenae]NYI03270.1 membrane protein [Allostreptomyces psammosilenae]
MDHRVTGLSAEAAFFSLLSLPPLLLGLSGTLGYLDDWLGTGTIEDLRGRILAVSQTLLTDDAVTELVRPLLDSVFTGGGRPDIISVGFLLALWSGSRALNVFVDTITIMYGLGGHRGIVGTRALSFGLYLVGLVVGAVVLPLMVLGPELVVGVLPDSAVVLRALYWPVVVVFSTCFLTTLYHVAVPVRTPWREDIPGALVALALWLVCAELLRTYLASTVEGPTVYGSLAAPVAVLLWMGVTAISVLIGAAVNAAVDSVWPSRATTAARQAYEDEQRREATELIARIEARRAQRAAEAAEADGEPGEIPPAEFPERWADFLPPDQVRARVTRSLRGSTALRGLARAPRDGDRDPAPAAGRTAEREPARKSE